MDMKKNKLTGKFLILMIAIALGTTVFSSAVDAVETNQQDNGKPDIQTLLTPEEKEWLLAHKTIRIAGPKAFPPFHYYEKDGALKGMASDYVTLILNYLNITPEIHGNLPWIEVLRGAEQRQIDFISCSAKTKERESYLTYTDPLLSFPLVIITKVNAPFIGGLDDLHGKKVAFIEGAAAYEWVRREKIKTIPFYVKTPLEALQAVSLGSAEAHIENLAAASYLIQKHGLSNLKVAAPTSNGNYNLHIAVRKDWPQLVSIINKVLPTITPQQHSKIRNKWLTVRYEHGIRKVDVAKWVLSTGGIISVILCFILIWNRRLNREIRHRKQAERELKAEKDLVSSLIDNAPTLFVAIDSQGRIIMMNQCMLKTLGYKVDEVVGKDYLSTIVPQREWDRLESVFKRLNTDNEPTINENHILSKDGKEFLIEWHGMPGFDINRKAPYFYGIGIDITERRRSEAALMESEEKYRQLVLHAPAGIYEFDMETLRFLSVNDVMCEYTDYTEAEFLALDPIELITEESQEKFFKLVDEVFAGNQNPQPAEYKIRGKNNREFWVLVNSRFYFEDGRPKRATAVVHDLTALRQAEAEKKQLEAQLNQAHKMEAIGTLAGGIAHDFNNILGIILGNTELAIDDVPEWNPTRLNLDEIKTASLRAKDVVRQLLSFARKTKLEKKPIHINHIVKESVKLLRSTIPSSIEIRQNISKNIGAILADPTQINQILINLCTNAAHSMPEGGILDITLQNLEYDEAGAEQISDLTPGQYVNLTVSDTGHGIAPEDLDRIFDPYFTTKDVGKGTGMGLAVVHGIVKGHNGRTRVESAPDKGTVFNIFFPVVEASAAVENETHTQLPMGRENILLVDDEISIAEIGRQMLKRLGYQVETKTNPMDALELFSSKSDQFDLVISDMTMPQMNGDILMKKFFEVRSDIPIILCTGFSEKVDEETAREIGFVEYMEKPLDMKNFAFKVRKVLDGTPRENRSSQ
jgi:PAS domain S-box-containing protein